MAKMRMAMDALRELSLDSKSHIPDPIFSSADGSPLGSWRFRLTHRWNAAAGLDLPYDINQPWTQARCAKTRPPEWCWDDTATGDEQYWTNVVAIVGPDTGFDLRDRDKLRGCGDLIILMEVKNSGIHWAEPGEIHIDAITQESLAGIDGDGVLVGFLDGQVWFLNKNTPVELFKEFCTASGARRHDREKSLTRRR